MKKIFCDCCSKEITKDTSVEMTKTGDHKFNGSLYVNAPANNQLGHKLRENIEAEVELNYSGDLCKYCIIELINQSDDRPRAA